MPRTSSTSIRSLRLVNPTRSANSTVTTLRSSLTETAELSAAPQLPQKRNPSGFSWPHFAQVTT